MLESYCTDTRDMAADGLAKLGIDVELRVDLAERCDERLHEPQRHPTLLCIAEVSSRSSRKESCTRKRIDFYVAKVHVVDVGV